MSDFQDAQSGAFSIIKTKKKKKTQSIHITQIYLILFKKKSK